MSIYNESKKWITESIESILNQTYINFEFIIIIDNPDLPLEIINYLNATKEKDNRIILSFNENNIGLARSLNRGLQLAKGEYIARMDADDISINTRLEKELTFLENNNFDLVSTGRILIDEDGNEIGKSCRKINKPEKCLPAGNIIVHSAVLFKKKVMDQINGYRDFPCSQDYDLWLRLLQKKCKLGIMDECLLIYRIRKTSISVSKSIIQYYTKKYQQKLYKQRKKKGYDSFSKEEYMHFLQKRITDKSKRKYAKAEKSYLNFIKYLKNKKIGCIRFLIVALFADCSYVYNEVKSALVVRLWG